MLVSNKCAVINYGEVIAIIFDNGNMNIYFKNKYELVLSVEYEDAKRIMEEFVSWRDLENV